MKKLMKLTAIIIAILALLMVAAIQLISTEDIFNEISSRVEQSTGRALSVSGDKQLTFFPTLSLVLNDVRFANAQNGSRPDMATIAKLQVHIPWLSIFSGELTVDKFVIVDPDILLETSADGQGNWQFLTATASADSTTIEDSNKENQAQTLPKSFDISLGQVEIKGGKLTFIDHQTGDTKTIDQLSLKVLLPSLRQTLNISGSVRYMAQVFKVESSMTTPSDAINNKPFSVELALTSDLANVNYQGEILKQGQDIKGKLFVIGRSVKELLKWQNIPLVAKKEAFNQFSLATNIHFTDNKVALKDLKVELDNLAFKGKSNIALTEPVKINANIDLGILNLNPYLPKSIAVEHGDSTDNNQSQPLVWDDTELDLSSLSLINAEIFIQSSQLMVRDIKLGKNKIAINLNKGVANVHLEEFQGYQGKGFGTLKVEANKKPYQINSNFELTNINAEPLLTDAIGFDKLLGKGKLAWHLSTEGISQRDFIHQLNGELDFSFIDGAVKGVNLAAIAKSANSIMQGDLAAVSLDSDFTNAEKTDFAALIGQFTLSDGVANIRSLSLRNPFVRVSAKGDIDLPKTELELQVIAKVVASAQGQNTEGTSSGMKVPIKITGKFHQIKIRPDVSEGAKDKLIDKVKDKFKNLFG